MKSNVVLMVEVEPLSYERAVTFATDVEDEGDSRIVYMDKAKALLALVLLAQTVGAEVHYKGERLDG